MAPTRTARPAGPTRPAARPSRRGLPLLVAAAAAVLIAAVVLWATGGDEPDVATGPAVAETAETHGEGSAAPEDAAALEAAAAPAAEAPVEVAHIHGLGLDPADGVLVAGTHYGLFRLPADGAPERVADRVQDFMGFTVVGPEHYLASGHPGRGQDGPSSLGLLESTDGGQTWQTLSLAGEADFHALEARHGLVYGVNALTGELLVSADGRTWATRARDLEVADLAVSPGDPDELVATTQEGPARSTDGGRTFSLLGGAPLLLLLDWTADGTLVGVAPDGAVHVSADEGATWEVRGNAGGAPQALEAADGGRVVVAVDGAIVESTDGGESFAVRHETA